MLERPVAGKELKKVMKGITEGERIDTARLISYNQGRLDERFALKAWIEMQPPFLRASLSKFMAPWFEQRDKESPDYGLGWNNCELNDTKNAVKDTYEEA